MKTTLPFPLPEPPLPTPDLAVVRAIRMPAARERRRELLAGAPIFEAPPEGADFDAAEYLRQHPVKPSGSRPAAQMARPAESTPSTPAAMSRSSQAAPAPAVAEEASPALATTPEASRRPAEGPPAPACPAADGPVPGPSPELAPEAPAAASGIAEVEQEEDGLEEALPAIGAAVTPSTASTGSLLPDDADLAAVQHDGRGDILISQPSRPCADVDDIEDGKKSVRSLARVASAAQVTEALETWHRSLFAIRAVAQSELPSVQTIVDIELGLDTLRDAFRGYIALRPRIAKATNVLARFGALMEGLRAIGARTPEMPGNGSLFRDERDQLDSEVEAVEVLLARTLDAIAENQKVVTAYSQAMLARTAKGEIPGEELAASLLAVQQQAEAAKALKTQTEMAAEAVAVRLRATMETCEQELQLCPMGDWAHTCSQVPREYRRLADLDRKTTSADTEHAALVMMGKPSAGHLTEQVAIATAVELAGWDVAVLEMLSHLSPEERLNPLTQLLEEAGKLPDVVPSPQNGLVAQWNGLPFEHTLSVLKREHVREWEARIWRAQMKVIFPFLERVRRKVVRHYKSILVRSCPLRKELGGRELVYHDPYGFELWDIYDLLRTKVSSVEAEFLRNCHSARTSLAHMTPVDEMTIIRISDAWPKVQPLIAKRP